MGDSTARSNASNSRGWIGFALGVAVGLALGGLVVVGTLAQRRRARRTLPWSRRRGGRAAPLGATSATEPSEGRPPDPWDDAGNGMRAARHWPEDTELDEELDQTFPASDPLPYSHRVD